jgi:glutathione synthase/RimK-type ligase-like ATP-grasp enzyme
MSVLIVTHTEDNICVPAVAEAITRRGGTVVRFDTDRFPSETRLVARTDSAGEHVVLHADGREHDLDEVEAVWHRRLAFGRGLPADMDPEMRNACRQESRASAMGMLASLRAFHLDLEKNLRHAEHKQLQMRVAREAGMEIPRTLITNDAAALRRFAAETQAPVVAKMLSSFAIHSDGKEKVVFTTALSPADLENLDDLQCSPMTFQELVPKALELRVTVVGDRVMAAAIDSASHRGAEVDWRRMGPSLQDQWRPHALPAGLEKKILALMDVFRLNYGALDFILTPDGRWVFLEINPAGEFFWLDPVLDGAISGALADVLLGRAFRRE